MSSQKNNELIEAGHVHNPGLENLLSSSEVCQKLKISQKTLQRWEKEDLIVPSHRINGRKLYEEWTILSLLNSKTILYGTGKTCENQIRELGLYLERKGISGEIRVDYQSPYDLSRPCFIKTVQEIFERKISHIIVTHEDRFLPKIFNYQDFFKMLRCSFTVLNKGYIEEEKHFDKFFFQKMKENNDFF